MKDVEDAGVADGLKALVSVIDEVCPISGTPGTSIDVLYDGEVVSIHSYRVRQLRRSKDTAG